VYALPDTYCTRSEIGTVRTLVRTTVLSGEYRNCTRSRPRSLPTVPGTYFPSVAPSVSLKYLSGTLVPSIR